LDVTLIVLCAGNSTRFEHKTKKQWIRIENEPLWLNVTKRLASFSQFNKIIVASHENELNYMRNFTDDFTFVKGGVTRQKSIQNCLELVTTKYVMISDVARACIPKNVIENLLDEKENANCIVPTLDVTDTVIYNTNTINRDLVKLIQTPQLSETSILKNALNTNIEFTDSRHDGSAAHVECGRVEIGYEKYCYRNSVEVDSVFASSACHFCEDAGVYGILAATMRAEQILGDVHGVFL
jgi:2-C-methyl-D-erythritol 4-phosphate cytidylyltransferase/2-C-methyl-D-erythritol 2,4-cyclodiphosphate synthase